MVTHMKTTIEISDALLIQAKRAASHDEITLRELIESALRQALKTREQSGKFKLRDASFGSSDTQSELSDLPWERLRELAYEGRGS